VIVLSTHQADDIAAICQRVVVLLEGRVRFSGTPAELADLAAGQVWTADRRDESPSPPGTRARAQLLAALGGLPASTLLVAAAVVVFQLRGAIGSPSPAVLVGGLLLVLAGAVIGVAVGARFPHPLAGVLAALVWFGAFSQTNRFDSGVTWLLPWTFNGELRLLPGPLSGYPPAAAHDVELAGIAGLAAVAALVVTARGHRLGRISWMMAGAVTLAVACIAGAVQLRPISTRALDRLAEDIAAPESIQHCTTSGGIRYCVYPGFGSVLPEFQRPVSTVLARLPARPARSLTVRQVAETTLEDPLLTYGHGKQQVDSWRTQMQTAPIKTPAADAVYPVVGTWPSGGAQAAARFDLALGTAEWAVGLPPSTGSHPGPVSSQCVPVDQAREAIAIWMAILATHPSTSSLQAGLPPTGPGQASGSYSNVDGATVATWTYPGEYAQYLASPGPQPTVDAYLLARAMTALPSQHVEQTLHQHWNEWIDPSVSNTTLAAALGIPTPSFTVPPLIGAKASPGPGQPVCTS
jgi:hypothetical protein